MLSANTYLTLDNPDITKTSIHSIIAYYLIPVQLNSYYYFFFNLDLLFGCLANMAKPKIKRQLINESLL